MLALIHGYTFGAAVVERGGGSSFEQFPRRLYFASASSAGNAQLAYRHAKQRLNFEMVLLRYKAFVRLGCSSMLTLGTCGNAVVQGRKLIQPLLLSNWGYGGVVWAWWPLLGRLCFHVLVLDAMLWGLARVRFSQALSHMTVYSTTG